MNSIYIRQGIGSSGIFLLKLLFEFLKSFLIIEKKKLNYWKMTDKSENSLNSNTNLTNLILIFFYHHLRNISHRNLKILLKVYIDILVFYILYYLILFN